MELCSEQVVEEGGFSARLWSEDCHNEKLMIVLNLILDPFEHLSKRGSLDLIDITIDDLHGLAVLKVLAYHSVECCTTL